MSVDIDWPAIERLSGQVEIEEGWDSLHTMRNNYPLDTDTGATLCVFPHCEFRRHTAEQMFKHVHFGPHGNSYGCTFKTFAERARVVPGEDPA